MEESGFVKLGALWRKKTADGQTTYLAGNLNDYCQVSVMPNKYKKSEREPDYYILVRQSKKKGETQSHMPQNDDL